MALIPCVGCGRQISDRAEACPKCGRKVDSAGSESTSVPQNLQGLELRSKPRADTKSSSNRSKLLLGGLFVVLAACGAAVYFSLLTPKFEVAAASRPTVPVPPEVEVSEPQATEAVQSSATLPQGPHKAQLEDLRGEWCADFKVDDGFKGNALMARVNFDGDSYEFRSIFMSGEFGPIQLLSEAPMFSCTGEKLVESHIDKDSVSAIAVNCRGMDGQGMVWQDGKDTPMMIFGDEIVEATANCSSYIKRPTDVSVLMRNNCRSLAVKMFFPLSPDSPDYCGSIVETVRASFERACRDNAGGRYFDTGGETEGSEAFLQFNARNAAILKEALPDQCK